MKNKRLCGLSAIMLTAALLLTACGQKQPADETGGAETVPAADQNTASPAPAARPTELTVRFGDDGAPFTLHLEDNETAAAIAGHVGTAAWRLPIYHFDDFENADVMQYYDIPSRYEIPAAPETVSTEQAGEVYYADPGRIVLFYQDAAVEGEYTKIGTFDASDDFKAAVAENPVLEGWGNKIVHISAAE